MKPEPMQSWIETWGAMGVLWGINRSMARVNALLIASDEPLALDDIAKRLGMSRGNASMCLKELRGWRVIHRVHLPGDRRDFYVAEGDVWRMFFRIVSERKRREFDPALAAVREALGGARGTLSDQVRRRLEDMEQLLGLLDRLGDRFLQGEDSVRPLLKLFLEKLIPSR
ncbi:MAG: ArsR family transcriptional regulator [Polyangia bacterium]|jgi:DNA-binding transcriptional regulator GbsR (MarR family)|nr:ArsR family transcriptional regulator [Polyangia bacterium]